MKQTTHHVLLPTEIRKCGETLAAWLNSNHQGKSYYRADIRLVILRPDGFTIPHRIINASPDLLKRYFPELVDKNIFPASERQLYSQGLTEVFGAALAISDALEHWKRVKECPNCKKFFYAHPQRKRFCSRKCQEAFYWNGQRGRAWRRTYMRKYRADQARRNARALELAARKGARKK